MISLVLKMGQTIITQKHLAFIACVVFAKFMMTFAKVKTDFKKQNEEETSFSREEEKRKPICLSLAFQIPALL